MKSTDGKINGKETLIGATCCKENSFHGISLPIFDAIEFKNSHKDNRQRQYFSFGQGLLLLQCICSAGINTDTKEVAALAIEDQSLSSTFDCDRIINQISFFRKKHVICNLSEGCSCNRISDPSQLLDYLKQYKEQPSTLTKLGAIATQLNQTSSIMSSFPPSCSASSSSSSDEDACQSNQANTGNVKCDDEPR